MKKTILDSATVLEGYDQVCGLYPYVPPLSHWRAWEYAAYRECHISGRILDLGCGDGRYFRLIWPEASDVVGVDLNPEVAEAGRRSGVYGTVHTAPAHHIPEQDEGFDHVFANCSLEHMDHLDAVLSEIYRCLKPGGTLLCSVVTDRFIEWSLLPKLVTHAGFRKAGAALKDKFLAFHHIANPLPADAWMRSFEKAGLIPERHIPILPLHNSGLFLAMDGLWHVEKPDGGELGDMIFPFLAGNERFPKAFRKILAGFLDLETNWEDCSGAVFQVRKPGAIDA